MHRRWQERNRRGSAERVAATVGWRRKLRFACAAKSADARAIDTERTPHRVDVSAPRWRCAAGTACGSRRRQSKIASGRMMNLITSFLVTVEGDSPIFTASCRENWDSPHAVSRQRTGRKRQRARIVENGSWPVKSICKSVQTGWAAEEREPRHYRSRQGPQSPAAPDPSAADARYSLISEGIPALGRHWLAPSPWL